jgi:hypothetical protein
MFRHISDNSSPPAGCHGEPDLCSSPVALTQNTNKRLSGDEQNVIKKRPSSPQDEQIRGKHSRLLENGISVEHNSNEGVQRKYPTNHATDKQQSESGKDKLNAHEQTRSEPSKHLVKTVADLPVFVTIEGFRVASYIIDGEHHLCLPHLLQFIQQKFSLNLVIDKFEKTVTNFRLASKKQIEGFIKTIVLPPNAVECPLIKRSDAERVCLALFDEQSYERSGAQKITDHERTRKFCSKSLDATKNDAQSKCEKTDAKFPYSEVFNETHVKAGKYQNDSEHQNLQSLSVAHKKSDDDFFGINKTPHAINGPELDLSEAPIRNEKNSSKNEAERLSTIHDARSWNQTNNVLDDDESEAQDIILNLARAATSTLRIKVYHRCFGKCSGLYYPSKLEHSNSSCIECLECHRLLSPRRFIGHTHKSKEENVCHWGFNSYHWRDYIHLCKTQDTNNLDEDELLVQFEKLLQVIDDDSRESGYGAELLETKTDFKAPPSHQITDLNKSGNHHIKSFQARTESTSAAAAAARKNVSSTGLERTSKSTESRYPINIVKPTSFKSTNSEVERSANLTHNKLNNHQSTSTWQMHQSLLANLANGVSDQTTSGQKHHISNTLLNPLQTPLENLISNPLLFSKPGKSFSAPTLRSTLPDFNFPQLGSGLLDFGKLMAGQSQSMGFEASKQTLPVMSTSTGSHSLIIDKHIKQDLFVSSSMASYLSSKGLDGDLIRDIIETTLNAIRTSRVMF